MAGMEHFLLILALLIPGFNGQDDKGSSGSEGSSGGGGDVDVGGNSASNALPDLPNAIHYPIYVPAYSTLPQFTTSAALDPLAAGSSRWILAPTSRMPDWSASSPFLAEVYDEQQLLQQRDMLFRRREELRKQRDKLKQEEEERSRYRAGGQSRDSYPNLVSGDSNPLIPRPVIDETEEERRLPAASFHNSGKRVSPSGGSEVSYIAGDTVFNDKEGTAARSIPVSSFESYRHSAAHQQPSASSYRPASEYVSQQDEHPNLRRESEQGRSRDAIHLHYFSRVRQ